jgi:uncharacterized membrane protein
MTSAEPNVPEGARKNMEVLRRFEDEEERQASALQLAIERTSRFFGSPAYFLGVLVFATLWIGVDSWGRTAGWKHMEPPPYFWLQGMVSLNALLLTVAVLIRQNRMAELAEHRAHLDLQINLLTEEKVARILEILGERPTSAGGKDDLTKPADAAALLHEIKKTADD